MTEPSAKLHINEQSESANESETADLTGTFFSCWIAGSPASEVGIIVFPPEYNPGIILVKNLIKINARQDDLGDLRDRLGVSHVISDKEVGLEEHLVALGQHIG
jgi:hypothetical protein